VVVVVLFVICDVRGKELLRMCGILKVEAFEGGKSQWLDGLISRSRDSSMNREPLGHLDYDSTAGTSRLGTSRL